MGQIKNIKLHIVTDIKRALQLQQQKQQQWSSPSNTCRVTCHPSTRRCTHISRWSSSASVFSSPPGSLCTRSPQPSTPATSTRSCLSLYLLRSSWASERCFFSCGSGSTSECEVRYRVHAPRDFG